MALHRCLPRPLLGRAIQRPVVRRRLLPSVRAKSAAPSTETLDHTLKRDGSYGPINSDRAFIEYERNPELYRDAKARLKDWAEINTTGHGHVERKKQSARCMDCGTPFCQTHTGCPIHNLIPEWNALVMRDQWDEAIQRLHQTNNFPEFTGRVCPAPCEGACVAGLVDKSVTIKNIEYAIVDRAWKEGWITPSPPAFRTGQSVAVIGSGPAGLAAADQLNQMGHAVTVYERAAEVGGLLTYGIPNMKLEKATVRRRVRKMANEGVQFRVDAHVGTADHPIEDIMMQFDAVVLAVGATKPRDMPLEGRELDGVHFAMDFLTANQNALFEAEAKGGGSSDLEQVHEYEGLISAKDKHVVVIGGGDTGTDCIGTSMRHGCASVVNFELLPQPPPQRDTMANPWPEWPRVFNVDYGHEEVRAVFGDDPRHYQIMTEGFVGDGSTGKVKALKTVGVSQAADGSFEKLPGTEREWRCDLAVLALGFVSPEETLVDTLGLATDARGNFLGHYQKDGGFRALSRRSGVEMPGVFVAGDCRRGQSLVVWAINEGRMVADEVNGFLEQKHQTNMLFAA